MFGLGKDECPMGTVPILRTTKDDLIREKSLFNDHILVQDLPGVHVRSFYKSSLKHWYLFFLIVASNSLHLATSSNILNFLACRSFP